MQRVKTAVMAIGLFLFAMETAAIITLGAQELAARCQYQIKEGIFPARRP